MGKRYRLGMRRGVFFLVAAGLAALPLFQAEGQERAATNKPALMQALPVDPNEQGDGTMGPAAREAFERGPLPDSPDSIEQKKAANAASDAAVPAGSEGDIAPAGSAAQSPSVPILVVPDFEGQFDPGVAPSDSTGAIGTTRYVQLVNRRFAIYDRTSPTPLDEGTLTTLAGVSDSVKTTDPQIIWDPTTTRFYYAMLGIFSATDNRLLVGFSKTPTPSSAADWCKYFIAYDTEFPDFPKLGDTQDFFVVGVNTFASNDFVGSDVIAVSKPPAGTDCPASLSTAAEFTLVDSDGDRVFTPVPGNQIDAAVDGYVVAVNRPRPSTHLWIFRVTRDASGGDAVIDGVGTELTVPSYAIPPAATQSGLARKLDTLVAQNTQAVLARNPRRSNAFSLWTQHTVRDGDVSAVRWYEINPVGTPSLRETGLLADPDLFVYNAAISPDRMVDEATAAFGDSFVITYSLSSAALDPAIFMGSSVNGGALSFTLVEDAVGPYRDPFSGSCPNRRDTCRWGDYSAATPDPRPGTTDRGKVWLTNQFAGAPAVRNQANWRTRIWAARP